MGRGGRGAQGPVRSSSRFAGPKPASSTNNTAPETTNQTVNNGTEEEDLNTTVIHAEEVTDNQQITDTSQNGASGVNPNVTLGANSSGGSNGQRPINTNNNITPLMDLRFPVGYGPQTTSSPGTNSTIHTPIYSSLTAQEIIQQHSQMPRRNSRLPRLSENISPDMPINNDGLSLREYVSATVGAAQATIMRQVEQNINTVIPQIIRESLRSERNSALGNQNQAQPRHQEDLNYRTPLQQPPNQQQQPRQQTQYPTPHQYATPPMTVGHPSTTPLQLEKWGLKFDGSTKSTSVEDFVFRVESLREDYNCPWSTLMKGFHHLVTGDAYEWFWSFRQQNPYCEWNQLKYHLIRKFRRFQSDFEIQRKIMERRQQPSESSDNYLAEIVKLKNQMRFQVPEDELVRIIKDNLKDGISQLVFSMDIHTISQLLEECRRAECNIAKRAPYRQIPNYRRVNELEFENYQPEEDCFQIEAIRHPTTTQIKQLTCWNCKEVGHSFVDCTVAQRNLFCYRCGFDNVITPKCPRCLGNQSKNMQKTGPTCSNQDPVQ